MTTHNLPASIESATSALDQLTRDTTEIADVLAMAFGLPFALVAQPEGRYGTLPASVERLAGSLDAIAKTAEAASSRLHGLARPVQLDSRPDAIAEPCVCHPAPETLTIPDEIEEAAQEAALNWTPPEDDEKTDDAQKKTTPVNNEAVIFRPPVTAHVNTHEADTEPVIDQPKRRRKSACK